METQTRAYTEALVYQNLVDEQLWGRLVNRIVKDEGFDLELAEKVMNEALGFLHCCALNQGSSLAPSPLVDIGWHTFLLYTREYASFCDYYADRFLHHSPNDVPGVQSVTKGFTFTAKIMQDKGYAVNELLWTNHCPEHYPFPAQPRNDCRLEGQCSEDCTVDCDDGQGPGQNCTCR